MENPDDEALREEVGGGAWGAIRDFVKEVKDEAEEDLIAERKTEVPAFEIKRDDVQRIAEMDIGDMKRQFLNRELGPDLAKNAAVLLAGQKIKIQRLKHLQKKDEEDPMKDVQLDGNEVGDEFEGFSYRAEHQDQAKATYEAIMNEVKDPGTQVQIGVSKEQIIVPSFATTAKIFNQHLLILHYLQVRTLTRNNRCNFHHRSLRHLYFHWNQQNQQHQHHRCHQHWHYRN